MRGAAARTGPTSRSAARWPRRDPRARSPGPRRTPSCGRRRRRAARARGPARPRAAARRAPRARRRRRIRRARRARPRRTPRSPAGPTAPASPLTPRSSPIAWAKIVFPAPVSPLRTFSPGAELELGLANEDEILDPEASQHRADGRPAAPPHTVPPSAGRGGSGDRGPAAGRRRTPASGAVRRYDAAEALAVAAHERRVGKRAEQRALLAEPDRDPCPRARVGDAMAVDEHGAADVGGPVPDVQVVAAGHDERPRPQVVRSDEGQRHRVEAPHQHRAAVREVVGRRAGRRRADEPVAGDAAEVLTAERPLELDHAPELTARDDGVVDGDEPLPVGLDVERRELDHLELAGEDAGNPRSSSSRGIALRKPTRPKLTPITGMPVPRNRCSARSIVPSPPSTIATSTSSGRTSVSPSTTRELDALLLGDGLEPGEARHRAPRDGRGARRPPV